MIEIAINKTVKAVVPSKKLAQVNQLVSKKLRQSKKYTVSLAIVGSSTIKKLNNLYRKKNTVTDVLSFESDAQEKKNKELGEIIICYSQLKKQAGQKKHSLRKEFVILYLHGLLHLFGYDHIKIKDALIMEKLEADILKKIYD